MPFGKKKEADKKEEKAKVAAPLSEKERDERIEALSAQLDKMFKTENSIQRMDKKSIVRVPVIPTGMPTFDNGAMECGGIPRGRIVEIYGPESAGKTSFTLHVIAEEQAAGGTCAFVDAEHALDPQYAQKLGVNVSKLLISQPNWGEQALTTVEEIIKARIASLIVVDSAAALTPKAELEGDMGDSHVGLQARMLSQAMRKLIGIAEENGVTVIFINQIREKIGVMYGSPETTPGGRALRHYASVRIDVRRKEAITIDGTEAGTLVGHQIALKVKKNKVGRPLQETVVDLYYEDGFDKTGNLIKYAVQLGVIDQSGSWFSFEGNKLAQGLKNTQMMLGDNADLLKKIAKEVDKISLAPTPKPKEA